MFTYRYTPTLFTPADAERITGCSVTLQRDWRRRNLLPPNEAGREARFNAVALGELLFMHVMADRGIGPQQTRPIADLAGGAIACYALQYDDAWSGEMPPGGLSMSTAVGAIRKIAPSPILQGGAIMAPLFIWWADGTEFWDTSVDHAIAGVAEPDMYKKLGGPVVVLDQNLIGALLVARAGRPLVHSERVEI